MPSHRSASFSPLIPPCCNCLPTGKGVRVAWGWGMGVGVVYFIVGSFHWVLILVTFSKNANIILLFKNVK